MLILQTLTDGPMHGYGVARWLEDRTEGALVVEEGSLYPALYRMEKQGWVKASWGRSENNRRARFYGLTATGRQQLEREVSSWAHLLQAIHRVIPESQVLGADAPQPA